MRMGWFFFFELVKAFPHDGDLLLLPDECEPVLFFAFADVVSLDDDLADDCRWGFSIYADFWAEGSVQI